MTEYRHTKGPWRIGDDPTDGSIVTSCSTFEIARVAQAEDFPCLEDEDRPDVQDEVSANMLLIAAAPDLLKAIQALRANIGAASLARNKFGQQLLAQADAAIAQAAGQQP